MAPSSDPPALPPTARPHRDAAYRFVVGGAYFAVISGLGSLAAVLFGPFGIVVSVLVSLVGVYYGGVEVARGVDVVVRHAVREERDGGRGERRTAGPDGAGGRDTPADRGDTDGDVDEGQDGGADAGDDADERDGARGPEDGDDPDRGQDSDDPPTGGLSA